MDRVSYSVMFERIVKSGHMTDKDFCEKYGYAEIDIDNFWSKRLPFDDPEEVEKSKGFARQVMESFKNKWAEKNITPTDLLNYCGVKIGIPYTHWTPKYWLKFSKSVSGDDDWLDGAEDWKALQK